jgi:leukotriene-A4 hydrolase
MMPVGDHAAADVHSFAEPERVRITHLHLDLEASFRRRILSGSATLSLENRADAERLVLDSRDLEIERVEVSSDGANFTDGPFTLGKADPILGAPLTIPLPKQTRQVRINYRTRPDAPALQWLTPAQTAGHRHPFLYTQSQAIYARSWIPLQDTPAVRFTYSARIRTRPGLLALMSAENPVELSRNGEYTFAMKQPIPSYLMALAIGDLGFQATGPRTGVYAEPSVLKAAANEFADTEQMLTAISDMFGPYRWGRYDVLVLPPSFPMGGMENPRLTFVTPTVIAGDRSLVALIAHELAHSWAGNLVTNATWSDFWLNEGFTVYLEWRILERVYDRSRYEMEAVLGRQELERELATLKPEDQRLHIDLKGRDPDEGFTSVPYVKGALLLKTLEEAAGRQRFDAFLRSYFDRFAFRSITTADFMAHLQEKLLDAHSISLRTPLETWLSGTGLPETGYKPASEALARVEAQARRWLEGEMVESDAITRTWTTQEWLRFLTYMPQPLSGERLHELDRAFHLTASHNYEILAQWLVMAVRSGYTPAEPRLRQFLLQVGRRKYLKPIYEELVKTPEGRTVARSVYAQARPGYHAITIATIDDILDKAPQP